MRCKYKEGGILRPGLSLMLWLGLWLRPVKIKHLLTFRMYLGNWFFFMVILIDSGYFLTKCFTNNAIVGN